MVRTLNLIVRNLLFTIVVPGAGGVYVPWVILTRHGASPVPAAWYATPLIAVGVCLYLWCVRVFAVVGLGTAGLWDAPRRVVAAGPYRWVRNPIYIAALLIVSGEAWLFLSADLLLYASALAVAFHLLVTGYEEPRLRARFGGPYVGHGEPAHTSRSVSRKTCITTTLPTTPTMLCAVLALPFMTSATSNDTLRPQPDCILICRIGRAPSQGRSSPCG